MCLVIFGILGAVAISLSIISDYFVQGTLNHVAIASDSKYPELALSSPKGPIINDPQLKAEVVFKGLKYSTTMVFLGPNDILVTEKDSGTVMEPCYNNLCSMLTSLLMVTGAC